jgi:hypothetical protein
MAFEAARNKNGPNLIFEKGEALRKLLGRRQRLEKRKQEAEAN